MLAARRIPLSPPKAFSVRFAPEMEGDLAEHPAAEELIAELEDMLARKVQDLPGGRTEKIQGVSDPELYKYRPHADNAIRIIFASVDAEKLRIVLTLFPRKTGYRVSDLKAAQARYLRFLGKS